MGKGLSKKSTRRDAVYATGCRMLKLRGTGAATAWLVLGMKLEKMGDMDLPKFRDLLKAIRESTIEAKGEIREV